MQPSDLGFDEERFKRLDAELSTIGAKINWNLSMYDAIIVEAPKAVSEQAQAIVSKHLREVSRMPAPLPLDLSNELGKAWPKPEEPKNGGRS